MDVQFTKIGKWNKPKRENKTRHAETSPTSDGFIKEKTNLNLTFWRIKRYGSTG